LTVSDVNTSSFVSGQTPPLASVAATTDMILHVACITSVPCVSKNAMEMDQNQEEQMLSTQCPLLGACLEPSCLDGAEREVEVGHFLQADIRRQAPPRLHQHASAVSTMQGCRGECATMLPVLTSKRTLMNQASAKLLLAVLFSASMVSLLNLICIVWTAYLKLGY
jgi:hypothetical protein